MKINLEPEESYSRYGFRIFREKVSLVLIIEMYKEYQSIAEAEYLKQNPFWHFRHLSIRSPLFQSIALSGYFPKLAASLIGVPSVRLLFGQVILKPAGYPGTPWHQDQSSLCIDSYGICTFWIPLEEIRPGFGGIQFAEVESRHGGPVDGIGLHSPTTRTDLTTQYVDLSLGSFTVHDGWAIHRAEANQSKKHRPAVNLVYYDANARIETTLNRNWQAARDMFFPGLQPNELA
ncbi:MAG: phytanoyl-CoA dioxygenase family protein, partial [Cyanobacteria bacterium P01_C01_bin.118]